MKALTLWQPWAHAIAHLGKRIENRTWRPPARLDGKPLAIHAGKTVDSEAVEDLIDFGHLPLDFDGRQLTRGAVVAVATFDRAIVRADHVPDGQGFWWHGPVGWLLTNVVAIEPVACRGAQGLWDLPPGVEAAVRACLPTPTPEPKP